MPASIFQKKNRGITGYFAVAGGDMGRGNSYGKIKAKPSLSSQIDKAEVELEMRPGGMLVQRRNEHSGNLLSAPDIRLKISYGAHRYQICVNSRATFGEVKKALAGESGLQPRDQQLLYRGREKRNTEYLDVCGVKDKSKLVLAEDPCSIERRYIENRRQAGFQAAHRAICSVSMEIDNLVNQVSTIETSISTGVKVPELQITTLIEMLMTLAIKLDYISVEGDVSIQKNLQEMRVKKCVDTLDILKISNSKVKPVVVTTEWETFDFNHPASTPQLHLLD